jgi:hypothetical protein
VRDPRSDTGFITEAEFRGLAALHEFVSSLRHNHPLVFGKDGDASKPVTAETLDELYAKHPKRYEALEAAAHDVYRTEVEKGELPDDASPAEVKQYHELQEAADRAAEFLARGVKPRDQFAVNPSNRDVRAEVARLRANDRGQWDAAVDEHHKDLLDKLEKEDPDVVAYATEGLHPNDPLMKHRASERLRNLSAAVVGAPPSSDQQYFAGLNYPLPESDAAAGESSKRGGGDSKPTSTTVDLPTAGPDMSPQAAAAQRRGLKQFLQHLRTGVLPEDPNKHFWELLEQHLRNIASNEGTSSLVQTGTAPPRSRGQGKSKPTPTPPSKSKPKPTPSSGDSLAANSRRRTNRRRGK